MLKAILPSRISRQLSRIERYWRRLSLLLSVVATIRGRYATDKRTVWHSIVVAPVDLLLGLDEWREPRLVADAEVISARMGIFAVRGNCDDLSHVLWANFAGLFDAIRPLVKPGDVVIDAGANLGAVTVFLSGLVGSLGKVIAIEMMPETAARLRRTVELNRLQTVTVVERAVTAKSGLRLVPHAVPGLHGQNSIALTINGKLEASIEVRTATIDEIAAGFDDIAFMKLDLEGAEPMALRGALATLPRIRAIVFESWQSDGGEAAMMLREAGFLIDPIDGRNFLARRSHYSHSSNA